MNSFHNYRLQIFTAMKIQVAVFWARPSETLVSYLITIWCHNPEDRDLNICLYQNIRQRSIDLCAVQTRLNCVLRSVTNRRLSTHSIQINNVKSWSDKRLQQSV